MNIKIIKKTEIISQKKSVVFSKGKSNYVLQRVIRENPQEFNKQIKPQIQKYFLSIKNPKADPQHPDFLTHEFWHGSNITFNIVLENISLNNKKFPSVVLEITSMASLLPGLMKEVKECVDPAAPLGSFKEINNGQLFEYYEIFHSKTTSGGKDKHLNWLLFLIEKQPEIFQEQIKPLLTKVFLNIDKPELDPQHPDFSSQAFWKNPDFKFSIILEHISLSNKKYSEIEIKLPSMRTLLPRLMQCVQDYVDANAPGGTQKETDKKFFKYFDVETSELTSSGHGKHYKWLINLIKNQPGIFDSQIKPQLTKLFLNIDEPVLDPKCEQFQSDKFFRSENLKTEFVLKNITINNHCYPEIIIKTTAMRSFLPGLMSCVQESVDKKAPGGTQRDIGKKFFEYFGVEYIKKERKALPAEINKLHSNFKAYCQDLNKKHFNEGQLLLEAEKWLCDQNIKEDVFYYNSTCGITFPKSKDIVHHLKDKPEYKVNYQVVEINGIKKFIIIFEGIDSRSNKKSIRVAFIEKYINGKFIFSCISMPTKDLKEISMKISSNINKSNEDKTMKNDGNIMPNLSKTKARNFPEKRREYQEYADYVKKSPFGGILWNLKSIKKDNKTKTQEILGDANLSGNYYAGGIGFLLNTFLDNGLLHMVKYAPSKETTFSIYASRKDADGSLNGKITRLIEYLTDYLEPSDIRGQYIKETAEKLLKKISANITDENSLSEEDATKIAFLLRKERYYLNSWLISKFLMNNTTNTWFNKLAVKTYERFTKELSLLLKIADNDIEHEQMQIVHYLHDELLVYLYTYHNYLELNTKNSRYMEDLEIIDLFTKDYFNKYFIANFDKTSYLQNIEKRREEFSKTVIKYLVELM